MREPIEEPKATEDEEDFDLSEEDEEELLRMYDESLENEKAGKLIPFDVVVPPRPMKRAG